MNEWVQVNVCVPTRSEQVALTDSRKSETKDASQKVENGQAVAEKEGEENMSEQVSFVQVITKFLLDYDLEHKWTEKDDKYLNVEFYCPSSAMDELVDIFDHAGIGKQFNSSYRITPCLFYQSARANSTIDVIVRKSKQEKEPSDFLKTMKSRFAVQQVVEGARNAGTINFDYSVFLLCAGLLAATGLVENSSVVLVASMLVSPIMGPILAGTFGMSIRDRSLYRLGIRNELISLASCLVIGFFYGLIYSNIYGWHNGVFITEEMKSRGQLRSLGIGLLVALPSGVGVALSVLGNNVGSLVGVAISASLLPPMVNAGILFSLSLVKTISGDLALPGTYTEVYSSDMNVEAACLAAFSICLTLLNILCIVVMGLLVLKVKQVVPKASNTLLKKFWTEDLPVVREQNLRAVRGPEHDREYDHYKTIGLDKLFDELNDDPVYKTVCAVAYRNPHGKLSPTVDLGKQSNMNRHSNPFFAGMAANRVSYDVHRASKVKTQLEDFFLENEEEVTLRKPTSPAPGSALKKLFKRRDTVGNMQRKSNTRFDVKKIPEENVNLNP